MEERMYYMGFSVFPGIGPATLSLLIKKLGSARDVWEASEQQLHNAGLQEKLTKEFISFRSKFSPSTYAKILHTKKISFISCIDTEYPQRLKEISNPPIVLFVRGEFDFNNNMNTIGVVGTRKITQYGRDVTEMFVEDLVQHGFVIVSGLAMGVDGVAHATTIENGGKTIAVLGCGVDCCTPPFHQKLYDKIIESEGCIVSEFPLSHPPTKGSFPSRNRIIAGLSQGVVVTEGAEDSGALITADYALKYSRKVFAVPGPITSSLSKGPYKLIQQGAKLVTKAEDVIKEIGDFKKSAPDKKEIVGDTPEEQKILDILSTEQLHIDQIVRRTGLTISQVNSILSLLQLKGKVHDGVGGVYSLVW